ncbi:MAG: MlaD family protein [Treponema sp.]|jgi:phospholipid/cholesterol/gamma-HCH transport system substrate-binding protein|nr:MlaD family protein [Treponema sp.]
MKFRIRYADQIVGVLAIIAVVAVIVVVFVLGSHQRWFVRDAGYRAYFESAAGLGENMAVQYKGIPIGKIKSYRLDERGERVEAVVSIYREYAYLVRRGSIVELRVSPIGLGNQFVFYAGVDTQEVLEEDTELPVLHTPAADALIARHLATVPEGDEGITAILNSVQKLLTALTGELVPNLNNAILGLGETGLGKVVADLGSITESLDGALDGTGDTELAALLRSLRSVVTGLGGALDTALTQSGGLLKLIDRDGAIYDELVLALKSANLVLDDVTRAADFVPTQLPQITALIGQLRTALDTVEDVLISLTNNPLLKGGIPARPDANTGGTSNRGVVSW